MLIEFIGGPQDGQRMTMAEGSLNRREWFVPILNSHGDWNPNKPIGDPIYRHLYIIRGPWAVYQGYVQQ